MTALEQELQLVREHKAKQQLKQQEIEGELASTVAQVDLIGRALDPLEKECEKIKLLYDHLSQ